MLVSEKDVVEWEMGHQKHHHVASLELSQKLYNCPLFEKVFVRNLLERMCSGNTYTGERKVEKL